MASSSDRSTSAAASSLAVEPSNSPRSSLVLSNPPPRRQVLFSELPPKHRARPRAAAAAGNCRPVCLAAVAWSCLAAFAAVLVVLLAGVLVATLLHAGLPEIAVRGVRFAVAELSRGSVTAEARFEVEFANRNDRTAVSFGALAVEASAGRVGLGRARVGAFSQGPRSATVVRAATAAAADAEEAKEIAAGPIKVVLKGHVAFQWGGIRVKGVPVMITCSAVKSEVDRGNKSPCTVRIVPV